MQGHRSLKVASLDVQATAQLPVLPLLPPPYPLEQLTVSVKNRLHAVDYLCLDKTSIQWWYRKLSNNFIEIMSDFIWWYNYIGVHKRGVLTEAIWKFTVWYYLEACLLSKHFLDLEANLVIMRF